MVRVVKLLIYIYIYISFLGVNFENLTVKFYVFYVLNMHIKFRSNRMLFTIKSINLFLYIILDHKNLKL